MSFIPGEPWRAQCKEFLQELQRTSAAFVIDPNSESVRNDLEQRYGRVDDLLSQGRFEEAAAIEEQRISVLIRLYGIEDERTIESMEVLCSALFRLQQDERSGKLLDAVIMLRSTVQGECHPSTLASVSSKVAHLHTAGQTSEAESLGLKVVELCREHLKPEDVATLRAMSNLASIYTSKGALDKAEEMCQEVLQIRQRTLQHDDEDLMRSMVNLAGVYLLQNRWDDAAPLLESVLTVRRRTLGDQHAMTMNAARQLQRAYTELGYWQEVETLQLLILNTARKTHDETHPVVQNALVSLASTYIAQGAWKKAIDTIQNVLHMKERRLPLDQSGIAELRTYMKVIADKFPDGEEPISDTACSIYKPLDDKTGEIRLVALKSGPSDSPPHASLIHASLDCLPEYEALSYVWGSRRDPGTLRLNEREMSITSNLKDALVQLRSETQDRYLWVDALCINQEDRQERGKQVQLMRSIYTKATRTLVWLGQANANSDIAMKLLAELDAHPVPEEVLLTEIQNISEGDAPSASANCLKAENIGRDYGGLSDTLTAALAKLDDSEMLTTKLHLFLDIIGSVPAKSGDKPPYEPTQGLPLLQLLKMYRRRYCTDPRDRIYALLGLSNFSDSKNPALQIDYTKSASEIYRDAARAIIEETGKLDILSHVQEPSIDPETKVYRPRQPDLPSWAPDWNTCPGWFTSLSTVFAHCMAAGPSPAQVSFSQDGSTLTAAGYTLRSISHCAERFEVTCRHQKDIIRKLVNWRHDTERMLGLAPGRDYEEMRRFSEMLCPGTNPGIDWGTWVKWMVLMPEKRTADAYQLSPSEKSYVFSIYQFCAGRKLFYYRENEDPSPSNMSYGLGPNGARAGDVLCVLLGCKYPLILHPRDDAENNHYYTVVGVAFVPEIMDGKFLQLEAERLGALQHFTIR